MAKTFGNGRDSQSVRFIREFAELGSDGSKALLWLVADNGAWLLFSAENAADSAYESMSSQGMSSVVYGDMNQSGKGQIYLSKVYIGDIRQGIKKATVPVNWIFAIVVKEKEIDLELESDLELLSQGPGLSCLSIMARYRIPTDAFGVGINRDVLYRLFELTVNIFFGNVALDLRKLSAN